MKALMYILLWIVAATSAASASGVVTVKQGMLRGVEAAVGVNVYRGIPYAAPPVDTLRWQLPRPAQPWNGVLDCSRWGHAAVQPGSAPGTFYWKEFFQGDTTRQSEDCLVLNVWAPQDASANEPLPVAVWIHGGAFFNGYAHEKEMDGTEWARRGVILVTANYRLGVAGFLAHDSIPANLGLHDQLAALQWVHDNIAAFGGDPSRVTLFGQSAGASSVLALVTSPLSQGLVHRAILQSGGGLKPPGSVPTAAKAAESTHRLMDALGAPSLSDMKAIPMERVMAMASSMGIYPGPCIDGVVITDNYDLQGTGRGNRLSIPYMLGYTTEDIDTPRMRRAATEWSHCLERDGFSPAWVYEFARDLPGVDMEGDNLEGAFGDMHGAFHSSELWYMFGTLDRSWRPMTEGDRHLSSIMLDCWTSFAATGVPSSASAPQWHRHTIARPCIMRFDATDAAAQVGTFLSE